MNLNLDKAAVGALTQGQPQRSLIAGGDVRAYYAAPNGQEYLDPEEYDRLTMAIIPKQLPAILKHQGSAQFERFAASITPQTSSFADDAAFYDAIERDLIYKHN